MAARTAVTPEIAPVTLIVGEEEFLVDRAVRDLIAAARDAASGGDVHDTQGAELGPGELASLTSPSLFGGSLVVVIRAAQNASKDVAAELARYVRNPAPDVVLVLTHAGGAKGKELLAATRGSGARVIECPKVTRFAERLDFIRSEFRRAGARADDGAARALLDAVGSDLRELAAACDQLATDAQDAGGGIDETVVAQYYRGRAEATGFTVADRAVEGNLAQSLELIRARTEHLVERCHRGRYEIGMGYPRPVETVVGLAGLVGLHLLQRDPVGFGIAATRDERGHAADRERAALVAVRDEQFGVRAHERRGHRHRIAFGQDEPGPGRPERLDDAEEVVPPARVETGHVIA